MSYGSRSKYLRRIKRVVITKDSMTFRIINKTELFELARKFQALVGGSWALKFHYKVLDRPVNDIDLITNLPMYDVLELVKRYGYKLCADTNAYVNDPSSSWKSVAFYWMGYRVEVLNPAGGEISLTENPPVCPLGQIMYAKLEMALMGFEKHQHDLYEIFEDEKLIPSHPNIRSLITKVDCDL